MSRAFEQLRKRNGQTVTWKFAIPVFLIVAVILWVVHSEYKECQRQLRIATAYRDILRTTGYECTVSPEPDRVVDCIEMEQKAVHPIPLVEGIEQ